VAIANPSDRNVLAAYGKAQAAAGQLQQALDTIGRAQTPDRPDWKLVSAEGAILDQLGRSDEARQRYRSALDIQPNDPSILSNLGMSYVLTGDLRTAETYLRQAAGLPQADSRVRQNLALVVGLQGRFPEAEQIARRELSQQQADANVAYLRSMLSQQNSWQKLAAKDTGNANTGTN
jgi:Flp pilus assembly protein TadD